jgi:hypothetical protein
MLAKARAKLKGYKTIVFNAVIGGSASLGLILEEFKELDLTPWFGEYAAKILVGIAIVGIVLRLTTNTPVGGRRARRRNEPTGYELLDDEDDGRPTRNTPKSRKARREG